MVSNLIYNTQIQQAMDKWGLHWFKFDGLSGNITDSKGTFVGTVTGATRVTGWNSEGYALNFDGNDYVQFNSKIIPVGAKTIRFKVKPSTIKPTISSNIYGDYSLNTSNNIGNRISITNSGAIQFINFNSNNLVINYNIVSTIDICDGQWHDILFTWDGTNNPNAVKLYVDDMTTPNITITAKSVDLTPSHNSVIGRVNFNGEERYFNGQIDDFQVYNKALSPEDFHFNKTLILSQNEYKKCNEGSPYIYELLPKSKLTSNTLPSPYIASASGEYSTNFSAWSAFGGDKTINTSSAKAWVSPNGTTSGHIQLYFGKKTRVTGFKLSPRNYSVDGIYNIPKDFILQGSDDGVYFADIKKYSNELNWTQNETRVFILDNPSEFYYYRLKVENIVGGGTYTYIAIGELSFINEQEVILPNWKVISPTLPTKEQFLSEGMDSLSSLLERKVRTLTPQKMNKSEILFNNGKLFTKSIDLKKYTDVRSINVEVE